MPNRDVQIAPPEGKLGILVPGMGAMTATFIGGLSSAGRSVVRCGDPLHAPGLYSEHDIFIQLMKLKNTLRWMRGEDLITHLGLEYYD